MQEFLEVKRQPDKWSAELTHYQILQRYWPELKTKRRMLEAKLRYQVHSDVPVESDADLPAYEENIRELYLAAMGQGVMDLKEEIDAFLDS